MGSGSGCNGQCVSDSWIPPSDGDWLDYYHSEFRGFAEVDITSPSGDLTVQHYASTFGWDTPQDDQQNYASGSLLDQEVYQGSSTTTLLQETQNIDGGYNWWDGTSTWNSCNGDYNGIYTPCEVMVISSRSTQYDGSGSGNSSAPWLEHDYTYDDYEAGTGRGLGNYHLCDQTTSGSYHNLCTDAVAGTNLPNFSAYKDTQTNTAFDITHTWTYQTNDTSVNGWVYYDVNKAVSSQIDDSQGNIDDCQSFSYDQNANSGVPSPGAGLLTTTNWYHQSACTPGSFGTPTITTYAGYDNDGNQLDERGRRWCGPSRLLWQQWAERQQRLHALRRLAHHLQHRLDGGNL